MMAEMQITEEQYQETCRRVEALRPKSLPSAWKRLPPLHTHPDGAQDRSLLAYGHASGLKVLFSAGLHEGRWWAHVSVSMPNRLPTWDEFRTVKLLFLGPNRKAIQVRPKARDYVNIHPYVLHLWSCLEPDGGGLPDFGRSGMI